jgi:hypothetical protein
MSHAENKVTQPDGDSSALCSGGLVRLSLSMTPEELRQLRRIVADASMEPSDVDYPVLLSISKKIHAAKPNKTDQP